MANLNRRRLIEAGIIFLSAFLLYANTLGHQYCLDDAIVITRNEFTQKKLDGIADIFTHESFTGFFGKQKDLVSGARYRPLSIATFAIEQEYSGGSPFISHLINILLYGLTGVFLYFLLKKMISNDKPGWVYLPLLATLLFIFHPVHTEVVANIKGRDEIMALLFSIMGCYVIIKYLENKRIILLIASTFLWLLGLFSKENAIVFWILLPMIIYLAGKRQLKDYLKPMVAFSLAAFIFLMVRHAVIGNSSIGSDELLNNSFLGATIQQKYATIFHTLWLYISLLIFPSPLTYDYYPYHISLMNWGHISVLLGIVVYVCLVAWMIISIRKNFLITFAIALYILPLLLVANIFFPIGTFMNERFVYFSSVGFCILVALGIVWLINYKPPVKNVVFVVLGIVLLLFSIKTISRNKAWYNDYTLFTTDVKTSFKSAKSNCSAGGILLESLDTIQDNQRKSAVLDLSIFYLKRSVAIHPTYLDALILLGNAYFKKGYASDSVAQYYTSILNINPDYDLAFNNIQAVVNHEKNIDIKLKLLNKMLQYRPNNYQVNYQLGQLYGKEKHDLDKSILYLTRAVQINQNEKDAYVDLGVAYGLKKDFTRSAEMLQKAIEIDPNDVNVYINLGITWQYLGETDKAVACFKKVEELKKK